MAKTLKVDPADVVPGEDGATETEKVKRPRKSQDERFEQFLKRVKALTIAQKTSLYAWLKEDLDTTLKQELDMVEARRAQLLALTQQANS